MPSSNELLDLIEEEDTAHHKQSLYPKVRSLLHPHWDVRSPENPWIFYNHHEYMHRVRTPGAYADPPSNRVLHLVDYVFDQCQSRWYTAKIIRVIPHLRDAWK